MPPAESIGLAEAPRATIGKGAEVWCLGKHHRGRQRGGEDVGGWTARVRRRKLKAEDELNECLVQRRECRQRGNSGNRSSSSSSSSGVV